MRLLTVATIAMLVLLAGPGFASAAVLTLTIDITDNQLAVGETTTYTVYGMVTDNTSTPFPGVPEYDLDGGLHSYMIDQTYTGTGTVRHVRAPGPPIPIFTDADITIQAPFSALLNRGKIVNTSWVRDAAGTGGVDNTIGVQREPSDPYAWLDPSQKPALEYGNGTPVALFTGTIEAVSPGTVNIEVDWEPGQCVVYATKSITGELYKTVPDTVVPGLATLEVVPEPASMALLALGGLAVIRRRRRK